MMQSVYQDINQQLEHIVTTLQTQKGEPISRSRALLFVLTAILDKSKADLGLNLESEKNHCTIFNNTVNGSKISWTGQKVWLIELIYALHTEGVFNEGKAQLKDIKNAFEMAFAVELGNVPRQFLAIRTRKSDATQFLDSLTAKLEERIDKMDGL